MALAARVAPRKLQEFLAKRRCDEDLMRRRVEEIVVLWFAITRSRTQLASWTQRATSRGETRRPQDLQLRSQEKGGV